MKLSEEIINTVLENAYDIPTLTIAFDGWIKAAQALESRNEELEKENSELREMYKARTKQETTNDFNQEQEIAQLKAKIAELEELNRVLELKITALNLVNNL